VTLAARTEPPTVSSTACQVRFSSGQKRVTIFFFLDYIQNHQVDSLYANLRCKANSFKSVFSSSPRWHAEISLSLKRPKT